MRILLCITYVLLYGLIIPPGAISETNKFKIGVIAPLTGSSAAIGKYIKNGIDLAYNQLPETQQSHIEIIYEDDAWSVPKSVSAFQKLSNISEINAVIVVGSAVGNAVAPLAEQKEIPLISIGASDHKVSKGRRFSFIHWVTPEIETQEVVKEIQRRKYKRLGIIGTEQEGVLAVVKSLKDQLQKVGMEKLLVLNEMYLDTEKDFKTYIAKARAKGVDGVIVCLFPGSLSTFAKQTRSQGLNIDLIGIELFEDENEVKASEGALIGQWYVNADSASKSFETIYQKTYGEHPGFGSANGFDALNLYVDALNKNGKSGIEIAKHLAELSNYTGAAGKYSATGDNRFTLPAAVKIVTESGFRKLNQG